MAWTGTALPVTLTCV